MNEIKTTKYDTHGLRVREEYDSDADGDVDSLTRWNYDPQGRLMSLRGDDGADGTTDSDVTFQYNELGDLREINSTSRGSTPFTIELEYDPLRFLKRRVERARGEEDKITMYEHDELGRSIGERRYEGDELVTIVSHTWDQDGISRQVWIYPGYPDLDWREDFNRNEVGQIIEVVNRRRASEITLMVRRFDYDECARLTEFRRYRPDLDLEIVYEYNSRGGVSFERLRSEVVAYDAEHLVQCE